VILAVLFRQAHQRDEKIDRMDGLGEEDAGDVCGSREIPEAQAA
jgi:hypothetical protein